MEHVVDLDALAGWADIGLLVDGGVINPSAEFRDVEGAYTAVVDTVEGFLGLRS